MGTTSTFQENRHVGKMRIMGLTRQESSHRTCRTLRLPPSRYARLDVIRATVVARRQESALLPTIIARPCNFALVTIMLVRLSKSWPPDRRRIIPEEPYRAPRKDCQQTADCAPERQ